MRGRLMSSLPVLHLSPIPKYRGLGENRFTLDEFGNGFSLFLSTPLLDYGVLTQMMVQTDKAILTNQNTGHSLQSRE